MTTNKALFLDRDGTINVDKGYVYKIDDFRLIDGILDVAAAAVGRGYKIIVVTNQSGIARGFYTQEDFDRLTAHMKKIFAAAGAPIDAVYHCPLLESPDRKPSPGMFVKARDAFNLDMTASVCVGDSETDVEAAMNAGVGTTFLLSAQKKESKATAVVSELKEVVSFLIQE